MGYSIDDDIQFLKHVGPARAQDFARLDIYTVRDMLWTFPRDMTDRSDLVSIAQCPLDTEVGIAATAVSVTEKSFRRRGTGKMMSITTAIFSDGSGENLEVVWFNQPWLKDTITDHKVFLHGRAARKAGRLVMQHPDYEVCRENTPTVTLSFGRIVPIYPCTGTLTQNVWRKAMDAALETRLHTLDDPLPPDLADRKGFIPLQTAVRAMHYPDDQDQWREARRRLAWTECFCMQLSVLAQRRHALHDLPGRRFRIGPELDSRIRGLFPFRLTDAQDRAIADIVHDMQEPLPMQRLLQGDVGSGKTAVAAYALLAAAANKTQACIMAPTGLLARQHYETFSKFLASSGRSRLRVDLLVGGMTAAEQHEAISRISNGVSNIVAATHSAISDKVVFADLGLVVIDEQHKFGVNQRTALSRKGVRPDLLVMTATPIPRSLALSVYGDLDLSIIDSLPPGRKAVRTLWVPRAHPKKAWDLVKSELAAGRQAFVVCPLVDENEDLDLRSAAEVYDALVQGPLAAWKTELLHGRMKRTEQMEIMERFRSGQTRVLVSTVVIEVGVDVPNATVMVVEDAERFGMAQLHQLRGRVGRGIEQGYFVMLSDAKTDEARQRLEALVGTNDGFKVAEADLRIRGPGDFLGTRQHGATGLQLVDLVRDVDLIADARGEARALLEADPDLVRPQYAPLKAELIRLFGRQWDRKTGT